MDRRGATRKKVLKSIKEKEIMLYIQRDRDIDITGKQTRFEEKIEKTGREMR